MRYATVGLAAALLTRARGDFVHIVKDASGVFWFERACDRYIYTYMLASRRTPR